MASLNQFINYFLGKRSEVKDLGAKDTALAKVVADIHRKRTHKEFIRVPLFSLHPVHSLDRENATKSLNERIATLETRKEEFLALRDLSSDELNEFLPSVSAIKVVQTSDGPYIAYEGNGRLGALHAVFEESDNVRLEVELYAFDNTPKMIRRLNRVRRMNGLID